jgi:hypothetical protein
MKPQTSIVTRPAWGQGHLSGKCWPEIYLRVWPDFQRKKRPMSAERQVVQDYLDALVKRAEFTSYFTEDVVATFEGTDQRADGRQAAGELIRYVHETAFDARPELKNLLVDTGKAAIEADFAGTHTGKFAGIQPHRPRRAGPLLSHLRPGR